MHEAHAYSEKRQFIRLPVDVPVTIEHDGQVMTAMCRNLSGSGLLAIADCALPLGSMVEVCIRPTGEHQMPFHASAEVSRVEPEADGRVALGLAIWNIHD